MKKFSASGVIFLGALLALSGCVSLPTATVPKIDVARHPSTKWTKPANCGYDGSESDSPFKFAKQTPWQVLESVGFVPDCYWWSDKETAFLEESSPSPKRFDDIGYALIAVGFELTDENYFVADADGDGKLDPATADSTDLVKATRYYSLVRGGFERDIKLWAYLDDDTLDLNFAVTKTG